MPTSNACQYNHDYYSSILKKIIPFKCVHNPLSSGYCIFHDEDYLIGHEDEIREFVENYLEECQQRGLPFECVGYHLPELDFEDTRFLISVNFTDAKFYGEVIFDNSEFTQYSDFSHATFFETAGFTNTLFLDDLNFNYVPQAKNILFRYSKFKKKTDFRYSHIKNGSFFHCEFEHVDFSECHFYTSISFASNYFHNRTDFTGCIFDDKVYFSSSQFSEELIFDKPELHDKCMLQNVVFLKPKSVYVAGDLSWVSFLNTDLSRIHFGNYLIWNNTAKDSKFQNQQFIIYDEKLLDDDVESGLELNAVLDVYRNLRENFDYYLRYDDAGDFFIREMELKRKYKQSANKIGKQTSKKNWVISRFSIMGWYGLISQYGHSLSRSFSSSLIVFSFFVVFFGTSNFCNVDYSTWHLDVSSSWYWDFSSSWYLEPIVNCKLLPLDFALQRAFSGFFPFYSSNPEDLELSDILLRVILLPISGSFFISLKRKLERKFRH